MKKIFFDTRYTGHWLFSALESNKQGEMPDAVKPLILGRVDEIKVADKTARTIQAWARKLDGWESGRGEINRRPLRFEDISKKSKT